MQEVFIFLVKFVTLQFPQNFPASFSCQTKNYAISFGIDLFWRNSLCKILPSIVLLFIYKFALCCKLCYYVNHFTNSILFFVSFIFIYIRSCHYFKQSLIKRIKIFSTVQIYLFETEKDLMEKSFKHTILKFFLN